MSVIPLRPRVNPPVPDKTAVWRDPPMVRWLGALVERCAHEWVDVQGRTIYEKDRKPNALPIGFQMLQRCRCCGRFRALDR